jgi:hypothetical protein
MQFGVEPRGAHTIVADDDGLLLGGIMAGAFAGGETAAGLVRAPGSR